MKTNWSNTKVNLATTIIVGGVAFLSGLFINLNSEFIKHQFLPYLGFEKPKTHDWSALDQLHRELNSSFDGDLEFSKMLEGAKKGLVDSLGDVYTSYMNQTESVEFQKSLSGDIGAGVGIEMGLRDGYVRVLRTLPDNPARRSGILAGDIIYKVDNEDVSRFSVDKIALKVRGQSGSKVKLTVVRSGVEKTFELVREKINNVSAYLEYSDDIAIIHISRFDQDTAALVQSFNEEFKKRSPKKIILDLRGNGGGYVNSARDILSFWIDGEPVLVQKSKHFQSTTTYANRGQAIFKNYPTVVLINSTSASAAEIVAGALQDYQKAKLVGETSFGKGVVQTLKNLPGGALLKVTTARWYTPKGQDINKTGIKPDHQIINTFDDINHGRDPQLDYAKSL